MTACAIESAAGEGRTARHASFRIAADRSYAARLNSAGDDGWYAERWTLDGPEPYAVPLPGAQPESPESQVLPLADGRVLIARRTAGAHHFALLYPTGPGTGELPLGSIASGQLTLLPPAPCGQRAYALVRGARTTEVWLVAGTASGQPEQLAEITGRCTGGAWLDGEGRLLALDHSEDTATESTAQTGAEATGGKVPADTSEHPAARTVRAIRAVRAARVARKTYATKTVVVDLCRGGEVTPLLQITDDSNDRLLAADPDSGLLLVRSDAPGEERIGWGVLGSHRPIRFPEALCPEGVRLTPLAVQPGQPLLPESCAVALRVDGPNGVWVAVWSPAERELHHIGAPEGWLTGSALWTEEGELRLPVSTAQQPCGLARLRSSEQKETAPRPRPGLSAPIHPASIGPATTTQVPVVPVAPVVPVRARLGLPPGESAARDAARAESREGESEPAAEIRTDPADELPPGHPEYLDDALPGEDDAGAGTAESPPEEAGSAVRKPVPLQQAPLTARTG